MITVALPVQPHGIRHGTHIHVTSHEVGKGAGDRVKWEMAAIATFVTVCFVYVRGDKIGDSLGRRMCATATYYKWLLYKIGNSFRRQLASLATGTRVWCSKKHEWEAETHTSTIASYLLPVLCNLALTKFAWEASY